MAAGKINLQKASGGITAITGVDGINNTQLVLPESGTVATTAGATETSTGLVELATTAETQAGTDDLRAITPLKLKNSVLGLGQTWQSFTVGTQRIVGTTYTNTTGKPIEVSIRGNATASNAFDITLTIDSLAIVNHQNYANTFDNTCTAIVPNGSTYYVSLTAGTLVTWFELR